MKIVFVGGSMNGKVIEIGKDIEPHVGSDLVVETVGGSTGDRYSITDRLSGDRTIAYYIPPGPPTDEQTKR